MLLEIKQAENIFYRTFIIGDGYLLSKLLPILEQKGEAGVEIKIIYDDLGSKATLKTKTLKRITNIPNCQITNYNPLGLNINPAFNYRDHRKITIIDGKIAYCGGDNFADEYVHMKERFWAFGEIIVVNIMEMQLLHLLHYLQKCGICQHKKFYL